MQPYLLVEETEGLAELLLESVLVDGVGDGVDQRAELVELQLSGAVSVELSDQLAEGLLVELLVHGGHDLTHLRGHDVALLSAIEHVEESLVL